MQQSTARRSKRALGDDRRPGGAAAGAPLPSTRFSQTRERSLRVQCDPAPPPPRARVARESRAPQSAPSRIGRAGLPLRDPARTEQSMIHCI